jgi:hypothetical protein
MKVFPDAAAIAGVRTPVGAVLTGMVSTKRDGRPAKFHP